jgi:spore coat protein CotH
VNSLRWRRHRGLVLALVVGIIGLVAFFGDVRLSAVTSSERSSVVAPSDTKKIDIKGAVPLFDDGLVHEIEFTFDPIAYTRMIQIYQAQGVKNFIEATVTIDGTRISSVGVRLKGNSTLGSLRRAGPTGVNPGGRGGGGGGPGGVVLSADQPESLPWLIKFDEFVKGQSYEGYEQLALRPASGAGLSEALALDLVGVTGEPTQRSMYTSLSVNGAAAVLRLVVEIPDSEFADDNFRSDGVLYKALSTGRFTYLSDDPLAYANAFKQITNKKQQDLKPLIELMKWVSQASDAEFAAHLGDHVDIESFARYVATQDLLVNFDDMAGPGSNYYLWYDLETSLFTVLSWDMNLAFGGLGRGGGAVVNVGGGPAPGGAVNVPPPGAVIVGPGGGPGGPGGFGGRASHALKSKFIAEPAFAALRDQARARAKQAIYGSGAATTELARLKALVASSGLISRETLDSEAAALLSRIQQLATAP